MVKPITLAVALMLLSSTAFAQKKATVADFAGTWNIELMSHQIALVIEPLDGNKVNATVTLQDDGTIAGEMMTSQGPAKWTGERLKTKKKG